MARDFTGNTNKVSFASSPANGLTQYSISVTMSRDSGGSGNSYGQALQSENATPATQFSIENDNGSGGWGLIFSAGWTTQRGIWSFAYPDTAYHNYVITYDHGSTANNPIIYKDGVSQALTKRLSPSGTARTSSTQLTIGNAAVGIYGWDGKIAEVAIWDGILPPDIAVAIGKGASPLLFPEGLVFYSPMVGRLSPEIDLLGSTTGTVSGTSNVAHPRIIYPTRPLEVVPLSVAAGQPTMMRTATIPFLAGSRRAFNF